jgi:phosphatidylserine/phosphatidylglycerophosphate/cardiolipin synthase-like enzyme
VICAFSVTAYPKVLEDFFPLELVSEFLNSGKLLQIFYNPDSTRIDFLNRHLHAFNHYENLIFTPQKNLHQKTLIADDYFYMAGSYNLLSSADSLLDGYVNMEASLVFDGFAAQLLTSIFENKFPATRR